MFGDSAAGPVREYNIRDEFVLWYDPNQGSWSGFTCEGETIEPARALGLAQAEGAADRSGAPLN